MLSCDFPWQVRVQEPPPVAFGVHEIVPPTAGYGVTSGAKFTRRDPGTAWVPTLNVVAWVRKWHSAHSALPCPAFAVSMSVLPAPIPASPVRCSPCSGKFVSLAVLLANGSSAWHV